MTLYKWSQTAANNATADVSVNWQEGQAPSSVNDSARAMMASVAKYRDDVSGALLTGGTSTAYTITSNQGFDTLNHMDKALFVIVPHATSGANPTLNVDGLGTQALRSVAGTALIEGALVAGTPYSITYLRSATEFIVHNIAGNPYNVPLGAGMDYWASTAPNSAFAIPTGQAISRTTYATLFALIGTTYGSGNGSTTFNLPDKSGRVSMMIEPGGVSRVTAAGWGGNSSILGSSGGADSITLTTNEMPAHTHANTLNDLGHIHPWGPAGSQANVAGTGAAGTTPQYGTTLQNTGSNNQAPMSITNMSAGSGNAHKNIQPGIICNYIIRII